MTTEDIAAIRLFAGLSREQQERIANVSREVQFPEGHIVVNQGEFAFDFYAIRSGAADVTVNGERVRTLAPGDVFGEMGVVAREGRRWTRRRSASVRVTAPTNVITIDGSEFRRLAEEIPALREAIDATAAERDDLQ